MGDKANQPPPTDPIVRCIGEMGLWQMGVFFAIVLVKFGTAWHTVAIVFLAPPLDFQCVDPDGSTDKCSPDCKKVEFDKSIFESTIATEWNLICDKAYLTNLSQTFVMIGILVGSIAFGSWSDKQGRRIPLMAAVILQLVAGVVAAFSPWFWLFCLTRFLTAAATGGTMVTSFVLLMEAFGSKWRGEISILYQIPFNIGHVSLAAFGYFLRKWNYFQFAISIPSVLLISYYWILPESPRWLFTTNNIKKATKVLERAAKWNKMPPMDIEPYLEAEYKKKFVEGTRLAKGNLRDLFRTRLMGIRTFCMSFNWLVCGFGYYGVAQYIGGIGGNIFINVAISAALGIPGTILAQFMIKWVGRRLTNIIANALTGISMIAIMFLPVGTGVIICASIGELGMSIAFPTVYLYAGELFPTYVRNVGIGLCSSVARIGAMIAPFVATLNIFGPLIFGVVPLIGAALCLLLPETRGLPLPETIEDADKLGKKPPKGETS